MKKIVILLSIFCILLSSYISMAQNGIISTIAGNGVDGTYGDGGPATSAELDFPFGIAIDTLENIYFVDYDRVRKITASNRIISTVAGDGTKGDGVPATESILNDAEGLALDDSGNIYIADRDDNCIRKVTSSTGIINTVAGINDNIAYGYKGDGGPATEALLNHPDEVAVDKEGNIYIADGYEEAVRKVTYSTGIITTIAGNGVTGYNGDGGLATATELWAPTGVAVDDSNNVFIADAGNALIRKITASTGIINAVAGNHALGAGWSGNGGPATAAKIAAINVSLDDSGNIYMPDGDYTVHKVTKATGIINCVAGIIGVFGSSGDGGPATNAELNGPAGVAVDKSGNMYITDAGNERIRKVTYNNSGINELSEKNGEVIIYPNPSTGVFTIQIDNGQWTMDNKIEIYDMTGEKVLPLNPQAGALNQSTYQINLSGQPAGIYFYRVMTEDAKVIGSGKVMLIK